MTDRFASNMSKRMMALLLLNYITRRIYMAREKRSDWVYSKGLKVHSQMEDLPWNELTDLECCDILEKLDDLEALLDEIIVRHDEETLEQIEAREYWDNVLKDDLRRNGK